MPEPTTLQGVEPQLAVWRLLLIKGIDLPLPDFRDNWLMDGTLESMQPPLDFHGLQSRGVHMQPGDLAHLELPTLVQLKDGSWLLLRARAGSKLVVEAANGLVRLRMAEMLPQLSGHALELLPGLPEGTSLWNRFRILLLSHSRALLYFGLASVLLQLLALVTPQLTSLVIGRALPDGAPHMLRLLAACVVIAALFMGGISWLRERVVLYLLTRLEVAVKRGFLDHVLRLPFPELQARTLGDLLQAFYGLSAARTLFGERALGALFDGVLAVTYLMLMGTQLLAPTAVMAVAAVLMALLSLAVGRSQAKVQAEEVRAQSRQRGYLTELIAGVRTVKAAGAERQCHGQWMKRFGLELGFTLKRQRTGLWSEVGLATLRQAFSVTMMLWGGVSVLRGEIGVGPLFGFLLLGEAFLAAALGMVNAYLILVVIRPQLARTEELLALPALPARQRNAPSRLAGPIVMRDVWFRYTADGPWVLKGYNLRIEPGDKRMLEGPSGSGKSTILRLLAGLYVQQTGTISIGGRDLRADPQRMLYLPQFVQLYGGSIIDNLRILSGGASSQRLMETAEATRFDAVVAPLAMRYQTRLPHGGRTLSGGQRQMLAVTAMIASDCDVLLLDEPMANIDPLSQAYLARILADGDKTIVSAGHV